MSKFCIAFVAPDDQCQLYHSIIENGNQDDALKKFFDTELSKFYSNDENGFFYFKEDFFDSKLKCGSIIEI